MQTSCHFLKTWTPQPYPSTQTPQYEEDYDFQPLPGETPEEMAARRMRLGLRLALRTHYDRMNRGE